MIYCNDAQSLVQVLAELKIAELTFVVYQEKNIWRVEVS
jgi:hypothetical protein